MSRFGRMRSHDDTTEWQGAYAPYDLIKELCVAIGVMALLATLLTVPRARSRNGRVRCRRTS
jgi:hypothetical protein